MRELDKKYYNAGGCLGVIPVMVGETVEEYTMVTCRSPESRWVYYKDLYDTYDDAKIACPARYKRL